MDPKWQFLIGPASALLGALFTLYVKDKSREIAKLEFAELIKAVLATFKLELLRELDSSYVRAIEHKLVVEARDDRIDSIDDELIVLKARILKLEQKSHE